MFRAENNISRQRVWAPGSSAPWTGGRSAAGLNKSRKSVLAV